MTNWRVLRDSFVAGLVLITPLLITLYILRILVNFALQFINPVVESTNLSAYTANVEIVAQVIAVLLIVLTISVVGFIAQRRTGERLFGSLGRMVTIIPLVRTIYGTVRQMMSSFSSSGSSYDSLVLVEYPRTGLYSIGLVTGNSPSVVSEKADKQVQNVFLPSSPNPANGRLVLVPEDQILDVDLSVREGLRLVMTTGVGSDDEQYPNTTPMDASTLVPGDDIPEDELSDHDTEADGQSPAETGSN